MLVQTSAASKQFFLTNFSPKTCSWYFSTVSHAVSASPGHYYPETKERSRTHCLNAIVLSTLTHIYRSYNRCYIYAIFAHKFHTLNINGTEIEFYQCNFKRKVKVNASRVVTILIVVVSWFIQSHNWQNDNYKYIHHCRFLSKHFDRHLVWPFLRSNFFLFGAIAKDAERMVGFLYCSRKCLTPPAMFFPRVRSDQKLSIVA